MNLDTNLNTKILYEQIKKQNDIKNKSREQIYNKILNKIQKKIFKTSSNDIFYILYEIPKFIIGEPLYSISKCAEYIIHNLETNGFKTKFFNKKQLKTCGIKKPPLCILLISWEHLKQNYSSNNKTYPNKNDKTYPNKNDKTYPYKNDKTYPNKNDKTYPNKNDKTYPNKNDINNLLNLYNNISKNQNQNEKYTFINNKHKFNN